MAVGLVFRKPKAKLMFFCEIMKYCDCLVALIQYFLYFIVGFYQFGFTKADEFLSGLQFRSQTVEIQISTFHFMDYTFQFSDGFFVTYVLFHIAIVLDFLFFHVSEWWLCYLLFAVLRHLLQFFLHVGSWNILFATATVGRCHVFSGLAAAVCAFGE